MQQQRPTTWPERGLSFSFRFVSFLFAWFLLCFLHLSLRRLLVVLVSSLLPCLFSASRLCISRPWSLVVYLPTQQLFSPSISLYFGPALPYLCSVLCLSVCPRVLPASAVYVYVCMCLYPLPRICRFVVHQQFMCKSILNSIAGSIALRFWDGTGLDDE